MKKITGVVVAAAMMLTSGVALAQGTGSNTGPSAGAMKKFQKETLNLRDELAAKQLDLEAEQDKAQPDPARISSLRKEIVDLEGRIQVVANNYGVRPWGRGHRHGMMHDASYGSGGWGYGCGYDCGCW